MQLKSTGLRRRGLPVDALAHRRDTAGRCDGRAAAPARPRHRIYFDFGTATLDAQYAPFQTAMDAHMVAAGYRRGVDWLTLKFEGAEHMEAAWRARVDTPLRFLLGG